MQIYLWKKKRKEAFWGVQLVFIAKPVKAKKVKIAYPLRGLVILEGRVQIGLLFIREGP